MERLGQQVRLFVGYSGPCYCCCLLVAYGLMISLIASLEMMIALVMYSYIISDCGTFSSLMVTKLKFEYRDELQAIQS